jgi:hypothetical protein
LRSLICILSEKENTIEKKASGANTRTIMAGCFVIKIYKKGFANFALGVIAGLFDIYVGHKAY